MSKRFLTLEELTLETLQALFESAGRKTALANDELVVASDRESISWFDPETGESEFIITGPFNARVQIHSFRGAKLVSMHIYNQTLDPGESDMQLAILAYCNKINARQNVVRAYGYDDDRFALNWDIPATTDGISTSSLLGALELFFKRAGSIQAGAF